MLYNARRVIAARRFTGAVQAFLVFILCGGCLASQLWCYKISFRLWSRYRPAYGTVRGSKARASAADPGLASNGTAASSSRGASVNGAAASATGNEGLPTNGGTRKAE